MLVNSTDPIDQLITLLENPRVRTFFDNLINTAVEKKIKEFCETSDFKNTVERVLLTSELKPIKRIAELETVTGLNDYSDFEEEHEPTIPERIDILTEKIEVISEPIRSPIKEPVNIPTSKTEIRACALVDHLKETGKDHLTTHEIISFLKCKLPESCRIEDNIQNIRKVKQDVLNKAASMYPNVFLSKKNTGHREVRLVLSS
jgi:hypothetical protein